MPDGRVLVVDGYNGKTLGLCEVYNPAKNSWTTLPPDPVSRWGGVAVSLGKSGTLVLDGYHSDYLTSSEQFSPITTSWKRRKGDPIPREKPVAVRLQNGKVLVVGGLNAGGFVSTIELYDPRKNVWVKLPPDVPADRQNNKKHSDKKF
jgi:hypothetical protein